MAALWRRQEDAAAQYVSALTFCEWFDYLPTTVRFVRFFRMPQRLRTSATLPSAALLHLSCTFARARHHPRAPALHAACTHLPATHTRRFLLFTVYHTGGVGFSEPGAISDVTTDRCLPTPGGKALNITAQ
jgi:hypothetical protein